VGKKPLEDIVEIKNSQNWETIEGRKDEMMFQQLQFY